jgi:hypothetical protein
MAASLPNQRALRLGRLSLVVGLVPMAVAALFTLAAAGAVLSGNAAFLENSRWLHQAYLALALAGEALAIGGFIIGVAVLAVGRKLSGGLAAGLGLNLLMALLFLPATLALLFNGFFALLEQLTR